MFANGRCYAHLPTMRAMFCLPKTRLKRRNADTKTTSAGNCLHSICWQLGLFFISFSFVKINFSFNVVILKFVDVCFVLYFDSINISDMYFDFSDDYSHFSNDSFNFSNDCLYFSNSYLYFSNYSLYFSNVLFNFSKRCFVFAVAYSNLVEG